MSLNRQLQIRLHQDQAAFSRLSGQILQELMRTDPQAAPLPIAQAVASRSLVQQLWDALPDESESILFEDFETQTTQGISHVPTTDFSQQVTVHLGWDLLAFSCSLEAAWHSWAGFNSLSTDTFNCCIYPPSLSWYVMREGHNLYPMKCAGPAYSLLGK